jgi:murein DD-endopeptidase MepM/ murein hydrolase activator NlpD
MKQKPLMQRIGDFMEGKGFYIVLFLCVTAIGISGYYLFSGLLSTQPLSVDDPMQQVAGHSAQVQVPPQAKTMPQAPATTEPSDANTEGAKDQNNANGAKATVYTWPVRGNISRDFSLEVFAYDATMGDWRTHSGMDIDVALGTEVMAVSTGTVAAINEDPLMGTTVIIDHGKGLTSVYANLAGQPTVKVGDQVTTGTVIGAVGDTAIAESSMPAHLHFEMKQDGVSIDPVQFLPEGS